MQNYVIVKINNQFYLFDVTNKTLVMTVAIGSFQHCFNCFCKDAEREIESYGFKRSNYRLHIKKF